jgi:tetratricopeptide (TPR) repeat protein
VEQMLNSSPTNTGLYNSQIRTELLSGDWEGLYQTSSDWLKAEPDQPVATFIQNITCLFINPPAIIRNKHYLETVNNRDWKVVLNWYKEFQTESGKHSPYFRALDFILLPPSKKAVGIEAALQEHPNVAELLFLQAISLRDRKASIEKLKLAVENKPDFPAALYLLGIFSLQMDQVQAAEGYLKQAVECAPDFLEAHYQLGSLYSLYVPNSSEQARIHFQKVIELDPEGGAGKDAKKILEDKTKPQYGQRIGSATGGRRGGMSILTILGISLLAVWLFTFPLSTLFKIANPLPVGIMAGMFVFIGLFSAFGRRK